MSKDMNLVAMTGNLVADPETRIVGDNTISTFRLAVNRYKKVEGKPDADFFVVVSYGGLAEIVGEYTSKGKKVAVNGRLQVRSYGEDDDRKWITEIIASDVVLLSPKED